MFPQRSPSHWPPSSLAETRRPPCFAPGSAWWPCPGAGGLWPTNSIGGFWRSFLKLGLGGAEHLEKRSNKTMENLSRKKAVNLCENQTSGFQNGGQSIISKLITGLNAISIHHVFSHKKMDGILFRSQSSDRNWLNDWAGAQWWKSPRNHQPICEPWCWYIYLQNWVIYKVNVGKYSSTMVRIWVRDHRRPSADKNLQRLGTSWRRPHTELT